MELTDFESFDFADAGIRHTVYRKGTGPAVLLLHELPGMSPPCIDLAREIARAGFSVYMPLLFGKVGEYETGIIPTVRRSFCISREFWLLANKGGSPIVGWLRALGRRAWQECAGPGIGVIGMCLTGNFAIALMADDAVLAPVAAEPSLPVLDPWGLSRVLRPGASRAIGVADSELAGAQARAREGVALMCLRFSGDALSPEERFTAIRDAFGEAFQTYPPGSKRGIEVTPDSGLKPNAHSVLTYAPDPGQEMPAACLAARAAVMDFLRQRLT